MPITNIISRDGRKRQRSYTYHTWQQSYSLYAGLSAGDRLCVCVCVKNYAPEMMQPSSSTRATIVSAENQNDATIVKDTFFFCHYYIVWESNNTGDARGQSWNESLKSIWIPGASCGYTSGTKRKHFAVLSSLRPWWRWLQLQPSCGSPQWCCATQELFRIKHNTYVRILRWLIHRFRWGLQIIILFDFKSWSQKYWKELWHFLLWNCTSINKQTNKWINR